MRTIRSPFNALRRRRRLMHIMEEPRTEPEKLSELFNSSHIVCATSEIAEYFIGVLGKLEPNQERLIPYCFVDENVNGHAASSASLKEQ